MGVIIPLDVKIEKLLSKTEAMVLLCSKASGYWSMIKFCFNIPLVFTSSAMCVINSISDNAEDVKIPNICVNAVSVLIMSLNNSIKSSEKCDLFRRLSQQFLLLGGMIENDNEITDNDFNLIALKYENLINDTAFEEIPNRYKLQVAEAFRHRHVPLQLNGTIGNNTTYKRPPSSSSNAEIVISNSV